MHALLALLLGVIHVGGKQANVLLLIGDDLNADLGHLGHPLSKTPHMDRLASEGVSFTKAFANHVICAPSRASLLTGIYGHTSNNYGYQRWFENPVLKNSKTVMELFNENGYNVIGTGKVMHHERSTPKNPRDGWDEYGHTADLGPFAFDGVTRRPHPGLPAPLNNPGEYRAIDLNFARLSEVPFGGMNGAGWVYRTGKAMRYVNDTHRKRTPDEINARWAANRIRALAQEGSSAPFFLAVGFVRPHCPIYVPDKYFDMFPLESIPAPLNEDSAGTHFKDVIPADLKGLKFYRDMKQAFPNNGIQRFTQAYLAGVAATDDNIGLVLDALDSTHLKDSTIVIVTGDHGWANGQHGWLYKNALWEEATRVPLIIRAPGFASIKAGAKPGNPVSLIDIYPTLKDLCKLSGWTRKNSGGAPLDGHSLRPYLEGLSQWGGPNGAISVVWGGNSHSNLLPPHPKVPCRSNASCHQWTYRTDQWRYIRYVDGSEELYDHSSDVLEQSNLAADSAFTNIKASMWEEMQRFIGSSMRSSAGRVSMMAFKCEGSVMDSKCEGTTSL